MVMLVDPNEFDVEIVSTPAMVENCLISGVATEVAMMSGEAPGISAETLIVGDSARGSAATGKIFHANNPAIKIATDIKIVATGLLIQNSEMFITLKCSISRCSWLGCSGIFGLGFFGCGIGWLLISACRIDLFAAAHH